MILKKTSLRLWFKWSPYNRKLSGYHTGSAFFLVLIAWKCLPSTKNIYNGSLTAGQKLKIPCVKIPKTREIWIHALVWLTSLHILEFLISNPVSFIFAYFGQAPKNIFAKFSLVSKAPQLWGSLIAICFVRHYTLGNI